MCNLNPFFLVESSRCKSYSYGLRSVIACYPSFIRFVQCLRRYHDTKKWFPHLVNAGKYSTTFFRETFKAFYVLHFRECVVCLFLASICPELFEENVEAPFFFSCCTVFLSSESAARHKWYETWEVLYRHVASCLSYSSSSVMYTVIITIEREIHFFNLFLSALTQVAGFTSYFLKVCITCSVNGILLFQSNLIDMLLHLSLPRHIRSLTSTYSRLFYPTLFSKHPLSLLETCPYHRTPLTLASPSKVSFKPSQLISSWLLLFSMNLTYTLLLSWLF